MTNSSSCAQQTFLDYEVGRLPLFVQMCRRGIPYILLYDKSRGRPTESSLAANYCLQGEAPPVILLSKLPFLAGRRPFIFSRPKHPW